MRRRELIMLLGGVASTLPVSLRADQKPMPVIGYLPTGRHTPSNAFMSAFREGLSENGYIEGKTWRSNSGRDRVAMIDCRRWPPIWWTAKST
jgi:hypothetical protein